MVQPTTNQQDAEGILDRRQERMSRTAGWVIALLVFLVSLAVLYTSLISRLTIDEEHINSYHVTNEETRRQVDQMHDDLTEIRSDVRWLRERAGGNVAPSKR